jgi:AP-2 complex subunit sigma-1
MCKRFPYTTLHSDDLTFNAHKLYTILDEMFLAGEIQETAKSVILARLDNISKLD